MTVTDTPIDVKAGFSTNCRAGNHATYQTIGARCSCTCHGKNGTRTFVCHECGQEFANASGLGGHRRTHNPAARDMSRAPKAAKPERPVLIELVDEEPPPPPAPKKKPIEQILELVETSHLESDRWWRVAMFMSSRAAKSVATRLTNLTDAGPYEWKASNDGRLFVKVTADG